MKKFKFTINGNKYESHLQELEDNVATIEINGTVYQVEIEQGVKTPKTPKLVRKEVQKKQGEGKIIKKPSSGAHKLNAPLPGSIFKLNVAVGDTVAKGDVLLVMEAMKMENNILADKDGTISAVHVELGQAVLQNDVLVEIE